MEIKLISLLIRDWKKIDELKIQFDGKDANIYGYNETGKTTIYDAFLWLLFGKDSRGRASFDIKPIIDGVMLRDKVSTVSAILDIDGKQLELTKTYKEKWIKPHGETETVFDSNETSFWVNEEPVKSGEYAKRIAKYIDEKTFRYITNADAFLSQKKEEMRATLIEKAGGIANSEIAGTDPTLVKLAEHLDEKGQTVDGLIKITKEKIKLLNAEIDGISPRIEEVRRNMPKAKEWDAIRESLSVNAQKQAVLAAQLATGSAEDHTQEIKALEDAEIARSKSIVDGAMKLVNDYRFQIDLMNQAISPDKLTILQNQLDTLVKSKTDCRSKYDRLSKELAEIKTKTCYIPDNLDHCEFCGSAIPADKYQSLVAVLKETFEADREVKVKAAVTLMNGKASQARALTAEIETAQGEIDMFNESVVTKTEGIAQIKAHLAIAEQTIVNPTESDPTIQDAKYRIELLRSSVVPVDNTAILAEMEIIAADTARLNAELATKEVIEKSEGRIAELQLSNRELAQKIAGQEKIRDACDKFMRIRTDRMTDAINAQYEYVKFRLFDKNNDGTVIDDCTPLVGGVSLYTNASRSQEIRAGLDIVRAIQRSSGITAPVFVDNSESANWLLPMNCQLIRLIVSDPDKTLRIEVEE